MASRAPSVTPRSDGLRRRLPWVAAMVVIALGGAGLATAADRPHTEGQRPELGFAADLRVEPWMDDMLDALDGLDGEVAGLADAARRIFISISVVEPEDVAPAIATGDDAIHRVSQSIELLATVRDDPPAGTEPWRLGDTRRDQLERIDAALAAVDGLDEVWRGFAANAAVAAEMVTALGQHDEMVMAAQAAGRDAEWDDALERLEAAAVALSEMVAAAGRLAPDGTRQFDELVADHRAHDDALAALYDRLARRDRLDDPAVADLRRRVERVRVPLPTPPATVRQIVAETGGARLGQGLAALEEARGAVVAALADEQEDEDG